jgi:chemotaxis protein MotB
MGRRVRRSKPKVGGEWLLTFCDMMTLLLTFFVLLISMATLTDENKRLVVLDSVYGAFGIGRHGMWVSPYSRNVLSQKEESRVAPEGPFEDVPDFDPLKPLVWEDKSGDVHFLSNALQQIFSIGSRMLFEPGGHELTPSGREFLGRVARVLRRVEYPVLITGHTANMRDELGFDHDDQGSGRLDRSWELSLKRTFAVYEYLLDVGLPADKLRIEAHARFNPRFTNATPQGRESNRRVELVLDKRNTAWSLRTLSREAGAADKKGPLMYEGFRFDGPLGSDGRLSE